ncbi:hypothetical protein ACF0H5_005355 [Mactra antiquata]
MKMVTISHCVIYFICLIVTADGVSVKRQALSSITDRGCIYVAHYVKDNYYDFVPDRRQVTHSPVAMVTTPLETTTHTNWVQLVYDTMRRDYVPMELFKTLMNCGKEYALYAINASDDLKTSLNVDYGTVPGLG